MFSGMRMTAGRLAGSSKVLDAVHGFKSVALSPHWCGVGTCAVSDVLEILGVLLSAVKVARHELDGGRGESRSGVTSSRSGALTVTRELYRVSFKHSGRSQLEARPARAGLEAHVLNQCFVSLSLKVRTMTTDPQSTTHTKK